MIQDRLGNPIQKGDSVAVEISQAGMLSGEIVAVQEPSVLAAPSKDAMAMPGLVIVAVMIQIPYVPGRGPLNSLIITKKPQQGGGRA